MRKRGVRSGGGGLFNAISIERPASFMVEENKAGNENKYRNE